MRPDDPAHIAATPHLRQAEALRLDIARRMTVAQKIENICALRQTAWDLKWIAVRRDHPTLSDADVSEYVRQLFLYGRA